MARERYSDENILTLLREVELQLTDGNDVRTACRGVSISDATYYKWRRRVDRCWANGRGALGIP